MTELKVITDLDTARQLWNELSPGESVFDLWDFRYCFYKYEPYPLYFVAAYEGGELVGLLPLDRHPQYGYEFFAEDPCEESRPFIKPGRQDLFPILYGAAPVPSKFFDISGDDPYTKSLPLEDYKYILPLAGIATFDDFLAQRLSSKKRRNIKQEISTLLSEYQFQVVWNESADIEELFALNVSNFGADSYLNEAGCRGWRDLLASGLECHLAAVKVGGRVVAASLSIYHNRHYYYLINGVSRLFSNLGKYLNQINIEKAIDLGAEVFDAGLGDCNWKKGWHLDEVPQYMFIKAA